MMLMLSSSMFSVGCGIIAEDVDGRLFLLTMRCLEDCLRALKASGGKSMRSGLFRQSAQDLPVPIYRRTLLEVDFILQSHLVHVVQGDALGYLLVPVEIGFCVEDYFFSETGNL